MEEDYFWPEWVEELYDQDYDSENFENFEWNFVEQED